MNKHYRNSYLTDEYERFNFMSCNRQIDKKHVERLMESIKEHGYVGQPISVNNNMEIINGQHRFEALKNLGMDIPYEVINTNNDDACYIMNSTSKNWSIDDYVDHWISKGKSDYTYLRTIRDKWPNLPWNVMYKAFPVLQTKIVENGTFSCSREDFAIAQNAISYAMSYVDILTCALGARKFNYHLPALIYCYREPRIDNDLLFRRMSAHTGMIKPVANMAQCISQIEQIYNYRNKDRLHISAMYEDHRRKAQGAKARVF